MNLKCQYQNAKMTFDRDIKVDKLSEFPTGIQFEVEIVITVEILDCETYYA